MNRIFLLLVLLLAVVGNAPGITTEQGVRHGVIVKLTEVLRHSYVDQQVGRRMADAVLVHERRGDYNGIPDADFAALLTRQLRELSGDQHLEVIYSLMVLPPQPRADSSPAEDARYREQMVGSNCTIERVELLPHLTGYLKMNSFPDVSVCGKAASNAMAKMNDARAIIFDLRDNRGGFPNMVSMIAGYLFSRPQFLYNPRENTSARSFTHSPVLGNKLADKPTYVLTSRRTISAAEQFAYNLKMLKRATIVGEITAGQAHAGVFHRIDDHFGIGVTEVRPHNPFSSHDWEGTGVRPDVNVPATEALAKAEQLVEKRLEKPKTQVN